MTDERAPWWLAWAAVLLGLPQVVTGGWAVVSPRGWYDDFPGFGPMLVSASPPFNAHLATDAGAGFLATGVLLLVAAATRSTVGLRFGLLGYAVFAVAHAAYHASHPAPGLSQAEDAVNVAVLLAATALPIALLILSRPRKAHP